MCKLILLLFTILMPVYCWSKEQNHSSIKPLFYKLLDNNNKIVYKKIITKPDPEIFNIPKVEEPESPIKDFVPTLNDDLINKINAIKKQQEKEDDLTISNNEMKKNHNNDLSDIKSELFKNYLEKQILDKNILQRAKKGSSTIKAVGNQVQSMSSVAKIESSPDALWKFGTKSDLIRQKSKFWLNSEIFNSKAEVIYKGFSNPNYLISVYKEIDLSNNEFSPVNKIHSSLDYEEKIKEFSSTIKTNINNNLDFSYKNIINESINSYSLNYHIGF